MNSKYASIISNSANNDMPCRKTPLVLKENSYKTYDGVFEVVVFSKCVDGCSNETFTKVRNISDKSVDLNQISSAFINIEDNGKLPWYEKDKFKVHFCRQCWLGEGQWQTNTLDELGLYSTYDEHPNSCFIAFSSKGSQTTNKYYPLVMIENTETLETHYFEISPLGSWYIEICTEYDENEKEGLFVFMSGSCEKNDGWHKKLKAGESYKTISCVHGTVKGNFEDAVAQLIKYKREISKVFYKDNIPPVCFNDYMNCCWAMPSYEKTISFIDKACEMGAEVFCVDDGWQASLSNNGNNICGDWIFAKGKFEPLELADVIKYANNKGMKFGIWLEIERCDEKTQAYYDLNDCLLKRMGHTVGNKRGFFDFRKEEVQNKFFKLFDKLYGMGIRYIKNDYNQTIGIGVDNPDSLSQGLRESICEFYKFIDTVQEKYPDLIIENCASGAMRSDMQALSHFHLQSVSDQEIYTCNPSIICGSLACIQPEKLGIWSYPYPVRYKDRMKYVTENTPDFYSDGKQTIFNMVNSMLGVMYLSGRIDLCDELNARLIRDAVCVYKKFRKDISSAYPVYPMGTFKISECGLKAVGLNVPEKKTMYLAVWNINSTEKSCSIQLEKYGRVYKIEKLYPFLDEYKCYQKGDAVKINIPPVNSAVFMKINFS